jgi:addiction module HigA family antidote
MINIGFVLGGQKATHTTSKLRIITRGSMAKLKPIHPGEILREEFMVPFELNPNKLALALRVAAPNVYEIVHEARGVSAEMALRLARYFGTTPEFWMNLQAHYDLSISRQKAEKKINQDVTPLEMTA